MSEKEILRTVKGFRKGLLGKESPLKMCYAVCFPLASYLRVMGVDVVLTEGEIKLGSHNKGITINHFWLTLPNKKIIDPTASQFNGMGYEDMPEVFFGEKPKYYKPVK